MFKLWNIGILATELPMKNEQISQTCVQSSISKQGNTYAGEQLLFIFKELCVIFLLLIRLLFKNYVH
jgi:hypothetical protein